MQINVKGLFSPIKLSTTEDFMIPVLETGQCNDHSHTLLLVNENINLGDYSFGNWPPKEIILNSEKCLYHKSSL